MQRFRGGLVFKAHSLCVSFNSRFESNNGEEEEEEGTASAPSVSWRSVCSAWLRGVSYERGENLFLMSEVPL